MTQEYTGRILSGSLVHTGGNTEMAHTTHHTVERPQFPPGTIRAATFTVTQYVPTADPALDVSGSPCLRQHGHLRRAAVLANLDLTPECR